MSTEKPSVIMACPFRPTIGNLMLRKTRGPIRRVNPLYRLDGLSHLHRPAVVRGAAVEDLSGGKPDHGYLARGCNRALFVLYLLRRRARPRRHVAVRASDHMA